MRHVDMDLIGVPVFVIEVGPDQELRTLAINRADEKALGVRASDVVGRLVGECTPPEIAEHFIKRLTECVVKRALHEYDECFGSGDDARWWRTTLTPVIDEASHRVVRLVGVSIDITERKETEGLLSRAAFSDPLTGLSNRRRLEHDVETAIAQARQAGSSFGLAVLDLDGFKPINDIYGHNRRDDVLRHVGSLLKLTALPGETVARLGGDEFALTLHTTTEAELRKRASDLSRFLNRNLMVADDHVPIGASLGSALWTGQRTFADLFDVADAEMYRIKVKRKSEAALQEEHARAWTAPSRIARNER